MKICFICHVNICRSFISQEFLKYLLQKDNRTDVEVISRGTYALDYLTVPKKIQDFLAENDIVYKVRDAHFHYSGSFIVVFKVCRI